ncbi:hypothetical protein FHS40_009253 [Streptomyces spectabilis]|uniref:Uncharacterized protein n=1 Tax=Streptomyces spectabilis TaxID=68270 RepID=A0A7W8B7S5_STRST|nr:hypothetical protein [Streptomyces spectabilis]
MRETGQSYRYGQCIIGSPFQEDDKSGQFEDTRARVENREVPVYRISAFGTNMTFMQVRGTLASDQIPFVYVRKDQTVPCPGTECSNLASHDPDNTSPDYDSSDDRLQELYFQECVRTGMTLDECEADLPSPA